MTNNVLVGVKDIGQRLFRRVCGAASHTAHRAILRRIGNRLHAVPNGRHDDHDFRAALLRQLFACRRADGRAGDRAGRGEPSARQAGRQVWSASGFDSDDHCMDNRRDFAGILHYRPRTVMDPVLHRAVHGGDSAVGRDEPSTLDHIAQRGCGKRTARCPYQAYSTNACG